ncbi:serine hydrolase [Ramlibacter sp. WS9]|uniref:serine hydrolase domain-containing protein n=1 Tax=Ramlibacter sp. WS9 TaxID=1882741 RepID=UPI00114198C3|nr:serine hydrolase [Ramlibacter sp. WS9]ROZ62007.1 class C beta-lactamase-related serine hydrolase [Ramlibacter sp. WS9]
MRVAALAAALLAGAALTVHAQGTPFRIPARAVPGAVAAPWKEALPQAHGLDPARVAALPATLKAQVPRLKGLVVTRNGELLFEYYREGYGPDDLHNVASVAKSLASALVGIAVEEGHIKSLDQKAAALLPAAMLPAGDSRFADVTVRHLLTMSSGLRKDERGGWSKAGTIVKRPMAAVAGAVFDYDSGPSHLLSVILTERTGMSAAQYAEKKLFAPLGIARYNWLGDDEGYSYASHDAYMTPRDMARFGQLYLQGGAWNGRQVVPAAYVAESVRKQVATRLSDAPEYGYLWWPTLSTADTPAYSAVGYGGQYIFVVPRQSLVVAAVSDQESSGEGAGFIRLFVLPAFWK